MDNEKEITISKPEETTVWNITIINEGRLFEHKQTGKVVFVPKQTDAALITKCMKMAIKSTIKDQKKWTIDE